MTTFEMYAAKLNAMTKAAIIKEGQTWGIWSNTQTTADYLLKHNKKWELVNQLAGRLTRLTERGY